MKNVVKKQTTHNGDSGARAMYAMVLEINMYGDGCTLETALCDTLMDNVQQISVVCAS